MLPATYHFIKLLTAGGRRRTERSQQLNKNSIERIQEQKEIETELRRYGRTEINWELKSPTVIKKKKYEIFRSHFKNCIKSTEDIKWE